MCCSRRRKVVRDNPNLPPPPYRPGIDGPKEPAVEVNHEDRAETWRAAFLEVTRENAALLGLLRRVRPHIGSSRIAHYRKEADLAEQIDAALRSYK